jgi:hypothetical protein
VRCFNFAHARAFVKARRLFLGHARLTRSLNFTFSQYWRELARHTGLARRALPLSPTESQSTARKVRT